jgi:hypothetical protein
MSAAGRPPAHVFDIEDIASHCRNVQGDFDKVWRIVWEDARTGKTNSCVWITIMATDCNGTTAPFVTRFESKQHGNIDPATTEGVAIVNQLYQEKGWKLISGPRTNKDPSVNVCLYDDKVQTDEHGNQIRDAQGQPVFPETMNEFGFVMQCFNQWYGQTITTAIQQQRLLKPLQGQALAPGQISVPSASPCMPMQTHVAATGQALLNPISRIKIPVDSATGLLKRTQVYDAHKPTPDGGYEMLVDTEGLAFNNFNAHNLIRSGFGVMGIADARSVCCSNMGISVPISATILVIESVEMVQAKATLGDLFGGKMQRRAAAAPVAPALGAPMQALALGAPPPNGDPAAVFQAQQAVPDPAAAFQAQQAVPDPAAAFQAQQFAPQAQPGFAPQAAPTQPGFAPQAAPTQPGFAPQAAPAQPGFAPQAAPTQPGFAPQAAPAQPGFAPQAAPAQPGFAPQAAPAQPGFAPQAQPGFAPPAQPGFAPQAQPGFAPPAQPGFAPQAQPGFAPQAAPAQPGFAPQAQPGFAPPAQPGFAPQAQPGFAPQAAPTQPGFAPQAQPGFAPQPAQPVPAAGAPAGINSAQLQALASQIGQV